MEMAFRPGDGMPFFLSIDFPENLRQRYENKKQGIWQ